MTDMAAKRQKQLAEKKTKSKGKKKAPAKKKAPVIIQEQEESQLRPMEIPKTDERCSNCGRTLKWVPINSRVRALVCDDFRCSLYRQRIKLESLPKRRLPVHPTGLPEAAGISSPAEDLENPQTDPLQGFEDIPIDPDV